MMQILRAKSQFIMLLRVRMTWAVWQSFFSQSVFNSFHGSSPRQRQDQRSSWTVAESTVSFGHAWLADSHPLLDTVSTTHNSWAMRWQADLGWGYMVTLNMQQHWGAWNNRTKENLSLCHKICRIVEKWRDCLRSSGEKRNHVKSCMQLCNVKWV